MTETKGLEAGLTLKDIVAPVHLQGRRARRKSWKKERYMFCPSPMLIVPAIRATPCLSKQREQLAVEMPVYCTVNVRGNITVGYQFTKADKVADDWEFLPRAYPIAVKVYKRGLTGTEELQTFLEECKKKLDIDEFIFVSDESVADFDLFMSDDLEPVPMLWKIDKEKRGYHVLYIHTDVLAQYSDVYEKAVQQILDDFWFCKICMGATEEISQVSIVPHSDGKRVLIKWNRDHDDVKLKSSWLDGVLTARRIG
jgi:hypothetical protein